MHVSDPWKSARRRIAVAALLLAGAAAPTAAQESGTVRGKVTGASSLQPLAGAQVFVQGLNRGSLTNANGEFIVVGIPAGSHTVRVQMIGFEPASRPVSVTAGQTATVEFQLVESAIALDEVVVTGTAAVSRKKEIGNSLATINSKQIENAPVRNAQDIIAARSPGVTVLANSGQPGAGGTIRLRGNNSITQGNNPIIYVDGVRIYSDNGPVALASRQNTLAINDIKAEDIERVEIVKGAAATTLYGTEASGGVVQIFTKKGFAGAPIWTSEVTMGLNRMGHVGPEGDPTGLFMNQCRGENMRDTEGNAFVVADCPESGSWLKDGGVQRYSLSVRGGAERTTYFLSGNFSDEEGVVETGWARDGGFRGNFGFRPREDMDINFSSGYTKRTIRWVPDGNNGSGFLLNVGRGPFGNFKGGKGEIAAICAGVPAGVTCATPSYILSQQNYNRTDHFVSGLTASWNPLEGLSNRFAVGYDYNTADNEVVYPFGYLNSPKGFIWKQDWNHTKLSLDYAGSLQNRLGSSLASTFSWGGQLFRDEERYSRVDGNDFSGPGDVTLQSAARTSVADITRLSVINAGLFLQEMIGWNDRLFVTAGLRVDGNSAFGEEFGLQPYPKISASYVVSDHDWWPAQYVETMKLRAAVGESGKAPGAFDAVKTWDPIAADDGSPAVTPRQIGNPNLGPERTREVELGFDLGGLGGRLGLEVTAFRARTFDALIGVTYPPTLGFRLTQLENVGTLQNEGLEVQLDGGLVRNENLDWRARLSVSANRSEVIDLGGREISTGLGTYAREGFPVGAYFGPRVMNPDEIAEPVVESDQFIGAVYPTRIVAGGTTITVANRLTLDVLGEFQGGGHLANWVGYQNARRGIWFPCYEVQAKLRDAAAGNAAALNDVTALERAKCAIDRTKMDDAFWIASNDFFKLRSVSLTYDLPERLSLGKTTSLTLSGRNLFSSTDYDGTDPEVQDARDAGSSLGRRDYYNLPPFRTFLASVRVSF